MARTAGCVCSSTLLIKDFSTDFLDAHCIHIVLPSEVCAFPVPDFCVLVPSLRQPVHMAQES